MELSGRSISPTAIPTLINNSEETERIARIAGRMLGKEAVHWKESPSLGVEDFAFFSRRGPEPSIMSAAVLAKKECRLHSSDFLLNEDCLIVGTAMQTALALDVFDNG